MLDKFVVDSGAGNPTTLDGIIYVNAKVILWYVAYPNGTRGPGVQTARSPRTELKKYDLNNPLEYGAFILDDQRGFEENRIEDGFQGNPYLLNDTVEELLAITSIAKSTITSEERTEIIETGKPYTYANTKRLAIVTPQNGLSVVPNPAQITLYEYDYNDRCEKIDFDQKKFPGTNRADPTSPCYILVDPPSDEQSTSTNQMEIFLLTGSFDEFDDYRRQFKTTFQELGFRSGSLGEILPFSPKRFEVVSQSRIIDEFDDILTGPVRFVETTSDGPRGTRIIDLVGYQKKGRRNKRTGTIVTSSLEEVVYTRELSRTAESVYVFKPLQASDITTTTLSNKTSGMWKGDGSIYDFYTSSLQTSEELSYKLNVVSGSCDSNEVMFSIYYGDFAGSGTPKISDDRKQYGYSKSVYSMFTSLTGMRSNNKKFLFTDNSLSQSLYLLEKLSVTNNITTLPDIPFKFEDDTLVNFTEDGLEYVVVSGSDFYYKPGANATTDLKKLIPLQPSEKIYAIQVNPKLLKNSLDEGNFELVLSKLTGNASPEVDVTSQDVISLVDSSVSTGVLLEGDTKDSYRYKSAYTAPVEYDIVSGSLDAGVFNPSIPIVYGKIYPGYGLIILNAEKLNSDLSFGIVSQSNSDGNNPLRLFKSISGSAVPNGARTEIYPFILRQTEASIIQTIRVDVSEQEFNYSTNPSYYYSEARSPFFRYNQASVFQGKLTPYSLKHRQWFYEPITYITSVGLYDDNYQLVAIGKLSKPIKKSFNESVKFVINLKY
jgi:hypothetical protein